MSTDQIDIDPPGDQGFERRIVGRLIETVKAPVLQIWNAWRELEAKQGAECEDVLGLTAAIGVMAANPHLALVVK